MSMLAETFYTRSEHIWAIATNGGWITETDYLYLERCSSSILLFCFFESRTVFLGLRQRRIRPDMLRYLQGSAP